MPKSVLPRARAPPPPGQKRGQSTGAGEYDFRDSGLKIEIFTPPPVPPRLDALDTPPERPEHGRGGVRFSRLSGLKMPKSVLPRAGAGAPQPRGQSTGTGQYFRDFQGSKSQKSVLPRARTPRLSRLKKPKSVLPRARGSTIFETFKAQNAEICAPPRPCPPAPGQKRGQSTGAGEYDFRDFQRSKCRNLYSPAPVPPRRLDPTGQSTGTWEYEFRNFQGSKCRNLYSRARDLQPPWTPCKFGKTFTSCHPHLRWSHNSPNLRSLSEVTT